MTEHVAPFVWHLDQQRCFWDALEVIDAYRMGSSLLVSRDVLRRLAQGLYGRYRR